MFRICENWWIELLGFWDVGVSGLYSNLFRRFLMFSIFPKNEKLSFQVRFLEELKTPKCPFEIKLSLEEEKKINFNFNSSAYLLCIFNKLAIYNHNFLTR